MNNGTTQALFNALAIVFAIVTGISYNNRKNNKLKKPLPMLVWEAIAKVGKLPEPKRTAPVTPYFGERPHFYTPPGDLEQYRVQKTTKPIKSMLTGEAQDENYHVIPYPNDPPHTFPAIKARAIFTKAPKRLREVYVESADPIQRDAIRRGQKVTLKQLEERYRAVYTNAQESGLDITVNTLPEEEMRNWERNVQVGEKRYDFHSVDALRAPPLEDVTPKKAIVETMW